jgi:hypothetical protein
MTGPEHYLEAAHLLRYSRSITADDLDPAQLLAVILAEAQVHATLALAAATALTSKDSTPERVFDAWFEIAGPGGEPR